MWLAQADLPVVNSVAILLAYGLMILLVILIPVALLRWVLRIDQIVKNQQEIIKLLRDLRRER